jgi:phage baseplate assembly protein W
MVSSDLLSSRELRGLALPALKGSGGYFESKGEGDVAWGDLLMALFVPIGGRVMRRSFGSSLYELLFDPIIEGEFQLVDAAIKDIAARNLPHVTVTRTLIRTAESNKGIEIKVFFRVNSSRDQERAQTVLIPKTYVPPSSAAMNAGV